MTPTKYKVIKNYQSPYPTPIPFQEGEKVIVGQKSNHDPEWENWHWCQGEKDKKAWGPKQYLEINGQEGVFIQDYNAMELTITPGEILSIYEIINGFGMAINEAGQKGWVPLKNIERTHPRE